jgi:hypothetical protein
MMNDLKFTTAGDYMKMNERIEELAEQANLKLDELSDDTFIPLEKFAELIVAECIGIVENLSPGYKDYRDQIEDAFRRDCVIEIKKRFGVE